MTRAEQKSSLDAVHATLTRGSLDEKEMVVVVEDTLDIARIHKDPKEGKVGERSDPRDPSALPAKASQERVIISGEENDRLLRIIDRHLMPAITLTYFAVSFDKNALSYASVFDLQKDTGLVGNQYSLLNSIVYIAQLVFQPASAYFLVKLPLSKYVPFLIISWSACTAFMALCHNFQGLIATRFFLGGLESSIAPAWVLYGQMFYRRSEQGFRICCWYSMNGATIIIGSIVAYGLGHIKSDLLRPYQIIFLTLGLITALWGIVTIFLLPDSPTTARFLKGNDKVLAVERVRDNQQGIESREFKWDQVAEMVLDLKSWCWMALAFLISVPSGGLSSFGPLVLQSFGFDKYQVMLLNMPAGFLMMVAMFASFFAARRFKVKSAIIAIVMLPCLVGSSMLFSLGREPKDRPALLVAYYLTIVYAAVTPLMFNWHTSNVAGHTKKAATTAFFVAGQAGGNITGPLLFQSKDAPYYRKGLGVVLGIFCALYVLTGLTTLWLWRLNRRNARRRVRNGKKADLVDYSMMDANAVAEAKLRGEAGGGAEALGEGRLATLDDLTDLKNDEFIYVY
ncbi:MFS general substrate transporter [Violaceomyces palustris]|uniref:MFS general substrate transporter n=1 Tax=Violaceomyces palustris TaxID=1673888 RepID=A0ACD0P2N6_9BASI|nr:MFS general substrate transporter [Violaceomyces palustris]